jgi:hypothetical protein
MTERETSNSSRPIRTGRVKWRPARPGYTHAISVGPKGLEALRRLGGRLAEKRSTERDKAE